MHCNVILHDVCIHRQYKLHTNGELICRIHDLPLPWNDLVNPLSPEPVCCDCVNDGKEEGRVVER